jgi:anti-sigma factor RsiW
MSTPRYAKVQGADGRWYITCEELHAFLDDYLAGELPAERHDEFGRHLARCRSCAAYLESYRATVALARAAHRELELDPAGVPPELVAAILAARA